MNKITTPNKPNVSILVVCLFGVALIINPTISSTTEEVFLWPKLWWIYTVVLPTLLLLIWNMHQNRQLARRMIFILGGWLFWLIISSLFNTANCLGWWGTPDRADGVFMHLIYGMLLLVGLAWARSEEEFQKKLVHIVLIGGSLLALSSVLQQVGILGVPGAEAISGIVATPNGGTLGHRGYMGGAMALLLPIAVAAIPRHSRWTWGWLAVVFMSWAWAGSFTRGAWLAGFAGLMWLLIWSRPRLNWRTWGALLLGIALCLVTAKFRGEGRSFSFDSTPQVGQAPQSIGDSSQRGVLWKSALIGIQERPLFGWGTPALWRVMSLRTDRELVEEFGTQDVAGVRRVDSSPTRAPRFVVTHSNGRRESVVLSVDKVHNEYLDYALTYGIPSALLFALLFGWSIWSGRTFAFGASAGLVAYAVYLMTWPETIRFAPIAWFIMGVALAGHVGKRKQSATHT